MIHFIIDNIEAKMEYTHENFYGGAKAIDWTSDSKKIGVVGSAKNRYGRVAAVDTGIDVGKI